MRVIAGTHRRRTLLGPDGKDVTRPITDRVKQSLFDRLTVMGVFEAGIAVDVFCGTGSLGIEALSRGSERAVFVDRDRTALDRLRQNLDNLGLKDRASVLNADAVSTGWLSRLTDRNVGIFFCDPPYALTNEATTRDHIAQMLSAAANAVAAGAVLSLRTDLRADPPTVDGWTGPDTFEYRTMGIHLYKRG